MTPDSSLLLHQMHKLASTHRNWYSLKNGDKNRFGSALNMAIQYRKCSLDLHGV